MDRCAHDRRRHTAPRRRDRLRRLWRGGESSQRAGACEAVPVGQRARIPEVDERHAAHREPHDGPGPQLDRSRVPQREHHALTGGYT